MINIRKSYIIKSDKTSCLCANISVDGRTSAALCFSVDHRAENWLGIGRADAFVMALLPVAVMEKHDIICEDPLSNRLHYQINKQLLPAMCLALDNKTEQFPRVKASLSNAVFPNASAVAASFSEREAFLRTLGHHGPDGLYPMTHIAVWNTEGSAGQDAFLSRCREAADLAETHGLHTIFLDTNFDQILPHTPADCRIFRELACALALEPYLSIFLLPTARPAASFKMDLQDSEAYALLLANSAVTETLSVYLAGPEAAECERTARSHADPFIIGMPYIEAAGDGKTRLCARIKLYGQEQIMWFAVNLEYGRYLTQDRADAFVAALLTPAMRAGVDIECQAPVSRELLYQLNQYLIPMMSLNMGDTFHAITLSGKPFQTVPAYAEAVCTSGTAGVDSMFSIYQDQELPADSSRKLTHLFLASNGAIERGVLSDTLQLMVNRAKRRLTSDAGLDVIGIDSNLSLILSENFLSIVSIRHAAVLLALQNLFSAGLIPSSDPFEKFEFTADNVGYYELAALSCLSTRRTTFYSSGGAFSRMNKLRKLRGFPLAQNSLHPCIDETSEVNCGECLKCIRTEAALYALDALDSFSEVFDADGFRLRKIWYFVKLLLQCWPGPSHATDYVEVREALEEKGEPLFLAKLLVLMILAFRKCRRLLLDGARLACRILLKSWRIITEK